MRRAALLPLLGCLLLGGCGSSSSTSTTATPTASGSPWIRVATGNPGVSVTPSVSWSSPTPFPTGFLPLPSVTPATATPTSSGPCTTVKFHGGTINAATVVPGTTSATVTWYNPGTADLVQYRVTAISQDPVTGAQRDVGWTVITPGSSCGDLSAPVTGLDRKTSYTFSVDAVFKQTGGLDGTYAVTVARSRPISTK